MKLTRNSIEVSISEISSITRNCYREITYHVTSPSPLRAEDFDEIRTHGNILQGQETGVITKVGHAEDPVTHKLTFWYHLRSICDSGD